MRGSRLLLQAFFRPAGGFGHGFVLVSGELFDYGEKFGVSAVTHRNGGVTAKAGALGAADGRSAKGCAEFFIRHFGEPVERRIYQPGTRLKFRRSRGRSFAVPGADILADIAAENLMTHAGAQLLGNRSAFLDGEIVNTLVS